MSVLRNIMAAVVVASLVTSCSTSMAVKRDRGMATEWADGVGSANGRLTVNLSLLDQHGFPISGERVSLITSRNETFLKTTQDDAGLDQAQAEGAAQFPNVRGGIHAITISVRQVQFHFSQADLEKGWDSANNIVNLVVRFMGGMPPLSRGFTESALPTMQGSVDLVQQLRELRREYAAAESRGDTEAMALHGGALNHLIHQVLLKDDFPLVRASADEDRRY